ncbi:hypothetical protein ACFQV2_26055 [Actinokineospora soli]|uniref:Uncharacterized protein n=1 Tax=Actinokineospora soli TaxID=1048753 RepID=A0ABW2TRG9_9PSEU
MTPQPDATPNPRPAGPDGARARELLARKWAYLLSGVAVIPLGVEELGRELLDALEALCAALTGEPFDAAAVERVGERIVALGYVGEDGLRRTAGSSAAACSGCRSSSRSRRTRAASRSRSARWPPGSSPRTGGWCSSSRSGCSCPCSRRSATPSGTSRRARRGSTRSSRPRRAAS